MGPHLHRLEADLDRRAAVLEDVVLALREGGLALLPAEGLYGLHARAFHAPALARLADWKGREAETRPYILLIGAPAHALPLVADLPGPAAAIIESVWPAPLTLLLPASPRVPPALCRGGFVALRCPGTAFLREILLSLEEPLVSTSANRSGAPPPRRLSDVDPALRAACQVAVDGGELAGIGSTVARPEADGRLTILRPGLWSAA